MATTPLASAGSQDLLELLRNDHLMVDELFGRYSAAESDTEKLSIVQQIYLELMPHAQAEEEIFYPALRDAASDEGAVEDAYTEHAAAKKTLETIMNASPDELSYDMKVKMLQKEIQQHVREEETILFQEARDAGLDLMELGRQVAERKQALRRQFESELGTR